MGIYSTVERTFHQFFYQLLAFLFSLKALFSGLPSLKVGQIRKKQMSSSLNLYVFKTEKSHSSQESFIHIITVNSNTVIMLKSIL